MEKIKQGLFSILWIIGYFAGIITIALTIIIVCAIIVKHILMPLSEMYL